MIPLAMLQLGGNQSALHPQGPAAATIARMSWILITAALLVELLVVAILLLALWRGYRRRHLGEMASTRVIAIGGLLIPGITLLAFLVYSAVVSNRVQATPVPTDFTIVIYGRQWWWEGQYQMGSRIVAATANELHIPVGRPVLLELHALDVIHSLWVPNLNGKTDLIPGRTTRQVLQADHTGVFRGQCAEFCGIQHAHMGFEVVAESPEKFASWLQWQSQPAVEPQSDLQRRGQSVFLGTPCALCHTVRGTGASGTVGPDLTHMAGRRTIAAATLPTNRGSLAGWIVNSQGVKPGNHMPPISLDPDNLEALLAYLEILQ